MTSPRLCALMQPAALAFECGFPVLAFGPPAAAVAVCCAGVGFHTANLVLMRIDFLRFWAIAYVCFIEDAWQLLRSHPPPPTPLPTSPLALGLCAMAVVAFIRIHDGRQWLNSAYNLYHPYLSSDVLEYDCLDLVRRQAEGEVVGKAEGEAEGEAGRHALSVVPLDISLCATSGIVRSFGYHRIPMATRGEETEYLEQFLPMALAGEGHEPGSFTHVRVVRRRVVLSPDGRSVAFPPAELCGEERVLRWPAAQ